MAFQHEKINNPSSFWEQQIDPVTLMGSFQDDCRTWFGLVHPLDQSTKLYLPVLAVDNVGYSGIDSRRAVMNCAESNEGVDDKTEGQEGTPATHMLREDLQVFKTMVKWKGQDAAEYERSQKEQERAGCQLNN
jgi:hypothetical protein